jgi:hypothetical protein
VSGLLQGYVALSQALCPLFQRERAMAFLVEENGGCCLLEPFCHV